MSPFARKILIGLFRTLLLFVVWFPGFNLWSQEFRGIWVDAFGPGFRTKAEVTQLVSDCRKCNFNALFVEMRARGDAFYFPHETNTDPRAANLDPSYDALAELLQQCHSASPRIEVHCWVVGYYVCGGIEPPPQKEHVFNTHPEYLTTDSIGQKRIGLGYFLDPGHPGAAQTLHDMALDIVHHYDIDGLHWDYLRYPVQDSGYNKVAIKRYQDEFGLTTIPLPSDPKFCEWRRRQVTDTMRWITADILELKPKLIVSASVFSHYNDSRDYRFQDWVAWNREGIVDITVPMDFSTNNRSVFNPRAEFAFTNQGVRTIYIGQAGYMNTKENTLAQLQYAKAKGFKGTVLYSYRKPAAEANAGVSAEQTLGKEAIEITVDNREAEITGNWRTGKFGKYFGGDYLFNEETSQHSSVSFKPKLPKAGTYGVYEWHGAGPNRGTNVLFEIISTNQTNRIRLNQQRNDARWNLLGHFSLKPDTAQVRVVSEGQGSNAVVVADAVKFVWTGNNIAPTKTEPEDSERSSQLNTFAFLKASYQPAWSNVPALPWKIKPTTGLIKGVVKNKSDQKSLYNAQVSLEGPTKVMQRTEAHGAFAFFEVKPGSYQLQVAHGGKVTRQRVSLKAGQILSVNIVLEN